MNKIMDKVLDFLNPVRKLGKIEKEIKDLSREVHDVSREVHDYRGKIQDSIRVVESTHKALGYISRDVNVTSKAVNGEIQQSGIEIPR